MTRLQGMFLQRNPLRILFRVICMRKNWLCIYLIGISTALLLIFATDRAASTMSSGGMVYGRKTIILDAGHGGIDGGAISCTGELESKINMQITEKLRDLFHLMGYQTLMIRDSNISVHTNGETIAQKKISDLKERVRIVNSQKDAILISIHQNTFPEEYYSGSQVFYAKTAGSDELAKSLQGSLVKNIAPDNKRKSKQGSGIFLLDHINKTGVLIECGFLSNREEEARLSDHEYQKKLCASICVAVCGFLTNT